VLLPLPLPVWCGLCMRGRVRMLMMAPHPIVGLRPSQPGDAAEQSRGVECGRSSLAGYARLFYWRSRSHACVAGACVVAAADPTGLRAQAP
jgi:hypothetical protein